MIHYRCPRCKVLLRSPDRDAGAKLACPQCGQRLQVPSPPPNKTLLAPLAPPGAADPQGPAGLPEKPPPPGPDDALQPPPKSGHPVAIPVLAAVLVVAAAIAAVCLQVPREFSAVIPVLVLVLIGVSLPIIGLVVLLTSIGTGCPKCGKWWAKVYRGWKILERKKCYGLVTRYASSSSSGFVGGTSYGPGGYTTYHSGSVSSSGGTNWQERVPVIRTTYELRYRCRYCGGRWEEERVEQVEDFDIERD
jgi:DNA-directed RNA polymerase subunit RPC12/RpoP